MKKYRGKKAFSLPEALLVIAIMGVIAVMIIPVVTLRINDNKLAAAAKGASSDLAQMLDRLIANNSGSLLNIAADTNAFGQLMCNTMKCLNTCLTGQNANQCYNDATTKWKQVDGRAGYADLSAQGYFRAILNNSELVAVKITSASCVDGSYTYNGASSACGNIFIDSNGFKGPNVLGRDIFGFYITSSALVPMGASGSQTNDSNCDPDNGTLTNNGNGCTALMLSGKVYPYN